MLSPTAGETKASSGGALAALGALWLLATLNVLCAFHAFVFLILITSHFTEENTGAQRSKATRSRLYGCCWPGLSRAKAQGLSLAP